MSDRFSIARHLDSLRLLVATTLAVLVSCGAVAADAKSAQDLSPQQREMVSGLLHEVLERAFFDYQAGKIYQEAVVHRHPRNLEEDLNPPIHGLAVVIGMFSPRYEEDEIRERIKRQLSTLRVGPPGGDSEISVSDYVLEFLPFGMMGGEMQVTIIPLSIEVRHKSERKR